MRANKHYLGMLAALLANVIFGFSFIFSKTALSVAHPLVILAVRFTVAFLALNILMLFGFVKIQLKGKNKKKLLLMCLAQPFVYFITELYGIKNTSSALSGVIIGLVPVGVIILSSLFLKEKPTAFQIVCTVVSIAGISAVSILSNDGEKSTVIGIFLLVIAVFSAAVFNILSRSESSKFSPFERTYFMFLVGMIGFNIIAFAVLKGQFVFEICTAVKSGKFIVSIIYLAVISSVSAFMLYNYSTTQITAVQSSSFSNIITVVSIFAGVFIIGEDFSILQILLCIPIVLGVWGVNLNIKK